VYCFDVAEICPRNATGKSLEINGETDRRHFLLRATLPTIVLKRHPLGALKSKSAPRVLDMFGTIYYGKYERTFYQAVVSC
jgi:hypothetical protein